MGVRRFQGNGAGVGLWLGCGFGVGEVVHGGSSAEKVLWRPVACRCCALAQGLARERVSTAAAEPASLWKARWL